ncbi:MAG: universal stress protein [Oceanospirillaceae bacterium]|nr:universal stress protein [Oceanospirillaceae bacterium]
MIPKISKILYVSDIEEGSRPAFRMAVSLAKQYGAHITFLHVIEPIPDSVKITMESTLSSEAYQKLQKEGVENLKGIIEKRISAFCETELGALDWQPKIEPLLVEGVIYQKIIETSEVLKADMIVMGTRTHSATKQFFMGSSANKVMRGSNLPVLVVPLT